VAAVSDSVHKRSQMAVREEKKQKTRSALLDAALAVMSRGGGFGALGLRELTREAGVVPTAFYRHFKDMDELGLALVEEGCTTLRQILRDVRIEAAGAGSGDLALERSVASFVSYVDAHGAILEFFVRERSGPSLTLRSAITSEQRGFARELANDLRLFSPFGDFSDEDLEIVSELIVNAVVAHLIELLLPADEAPARDVVITSRIEAQIRIILLGAARWRRATTMPVKST